MRVGRGDSGRNPDESNVLCGVCVVALGTATNASAQSATIANNSYSSPVRGNSIFPEGDGVSDAGTTVTHVVVHAEKLDPATGGYTSFLGNVRSTQIPAPSQGNNGAAYVYTWSTLDFYGLGQGTYKIKATVHGRLNGANNTPPSPLHFQVKFFTF